MRGAEPRAAAIDRERRLRQRSDEVALRPRADERPLGAEIGPSLFIRNGRLRHIKTDEGEETVTTNGTFIDLHGLLADAASVEVRSDGHAMSIEVTYHSASAVLSLADYDVLALDRTRHKHQQGPPTGTSSATSED